MKRFIHYALGLLSLWTVTTMAAASFPCYIELHKTKCWANYSITLQRIDVLTQTLNKQKLLLPKDKSKGLFPIQCIPGQQLSLQATFSPAIWQDKTDMVYKGIKIYGIPLKLPAGSDKWVIPVCFSNDFTGVPLPPSATEFCRCKNKPENIEPAF